MVIDNAGYVGIGTTGPSYKLDVQGGQVNASGGLCMSGDCKTAWSQVGGGGSAEGWSRTGTAVHLTTSTDHVGIGTTTPATALHVAGTVTADAFSGPMTGSLNAGYVSAGTFGSLSSAGNYYFDTDTLSIDAGNHRVGIGTASPGEKLHLAQGNFGLSQTSADAYVFLGDTANFGAGTYGYAKWDYANDKLQLGTSAGGVGLTLEEDGKVGIGTTSPPFRLSVDADDGLNSLLYLRNSDGAGDGDAAARFTVSGGNDWVIGVDDSDSDKFKISDNSQLGTNDYVTIQTDGNVGIGTTSPARSLHVHTPSGGWVARFSSGSYYTDTYNNADWAEFVTNSSRWYLDKELRVDTGLIGSYNENLVLRTSGTNRITVLNSNGNVGIGTTGPNYKLDVQGGQVNASGGLCMSGDCKTAWSEVGGGGGTNYWSISGNNLAPTSTAYKVGIGTASPSAKLDILGTANEPQLEITAYSTQSNTNPLILLKNSGGSEILRIHSNEDDWNTFVGGYAGAANTTGYQNTGVGRETLESNTTGYYNVAVGSVALDANTTGHDNVAVGRNALGSNVAAHYNTAVGSEALRALSGEYYYNTAVGARALYNNTSSGNSALGKDTLYTNTTGYYNVGVGYEALSSNSSGYQNTAVGRGTLDNNTTGDNNTAIGMDANVSTGNLTNATAIGYGASVNASNKVRIGNSSISVIEGKVAWSYPSDIRLKREVQDSDLGLSFINKLRPVSYKLKNGDDNINYGFVAQEVEMVLGGKKTNIVMTSGDRDGTKTMRYTEFIAPMVRAMQEQQVQIEALKAENDALQARISALERKVR